MSSPEGPMSLKPLRMNVHDTNIIEPFRVELNPDVPLTETDDSSIETKSQEPRPLTSPAFPGARTGLLSSKLSDDPDPPKPTQTVRTSARRFERPNYLRILAHTGCCCVAYPIIHFGAGRVKNMSLFQARAIVGVLCTGIGGVIGWNLVAFATRYAEATTWATVIHLSHGDNGPGIKLKELANKAHQPESALSGVKLLWTRRRARRAVDSRPWSFFIMFYVILTLAAAGLSFILGRVINISTRLEHQLETFTETTIWGDLSESDIAAASAQLLSLTRNGGTWTLAAFTDRSPLPAAVRLKYNGDNVYFAELVQSQLKSDGKGLGTFVQNGTVSDVDEPTTSSMGGLSEGSLLKIPRWGIRMHCEKLPEPEKYLVPRSNGTATYVIITRAFLEKLFSSVSVPLPEQFTVPNPSLLNPNDTLPSSVSEEELGYVAGFWDDGMAHSFHRFTPIAGESGNGWVTTETALVRLNNLYAPNATFPIWSDPIVDQFFGTDGRIGYDAVVCVRMYEPWIVQIYNSSLGVPTTMAIVGHSASTDFEADYGNRGPHLDSYTRALNSTGKRPAHFISYENAIRQMMKDNDIKLRYMPSPTTVSFTGNVGVEGYTELSPQFYADVRGNVDALYALPFLSGTRPIVVRAYRDVVLASASFNPYILGGVLGIALLLGVLAGFFVPALPFDIPRRGFGMFSWVAVLYGQELGGEFLQDDVNLHMDLKELENTLGEKRVHFIIQ